MTSGLHVTNNKAVSTQLSWNFNNKNWFRLDGTVIRQLQGNKGMAGLIVDVICDKRMTKERVNKGEPWNSHPKTNWNSRCCLFFCRCWGPSPMMAGRPSASPALVATQVIGATFSGIISMAERRRGADASEGRFAAGSIRAGWWPNTKPTTLAYCFFLLFFILRLQRSLLLSVFIHWKKKK